ncbi:hypothetical protein Anapl_05354 [Anas platyrhynchos]|uniref:Uncharacterized protein n=1 Tax=Anas platyrhynchos TaxID=8839 RepID=R0K055_ANAPL|nr:hypothetical protein Anapl_05354 [Anas platyrhynchos]
MKHSTGRQMWKDILLFVLFECNLHSASLKMVAGSRVFKATQGCHVSGPDTNQNDSADFPRSLNWTQAAKTSLLHPARTFSLPIHCLQCRECHCKKRERENAGSPYFLCSLAGGGALSILHSFAIQDARAVPAVAAGYQAASHPSLHASGSSRRGEEHPGSCLRPPWLLDTKNLQKNHGHSALLILLIMAEVSMGSLEITQEVGVLQAACWAFERMPQDTEPDARVSREADSRGLNPALLLAAAPERKRAVKVVCLRCKTAACETLKSSPWPGVTYCSCQHSEINLMGSRYRASDEMMSQIPGRISAYASSTKTRQSPHKHPSSYFNHEWEASDGGGKNEHKISALVVFASIIQCFSFREDAAQRCCGVASAAHLHGSPVLILLHLLCSHWVFLHQLHMAESTPVLHLSEAKVAVTQDTGPSHPEVSSCGLWLRAATALASATLGTVCVLGGCKSRGASALVWFKEHQRLGRALKNSFIGSQTGGRIRRTRFKTQCVQSHSHGLKSTRQHPRNNHEKSRRGEPPASGAGVCPVRPIRPSHPICPSRRGGAAQCRWQSLRLAESRCDARQLGEMASLGPCLHDGLHGGLAESTDPARSRGSNELLRRFLGGHPVSPQRRE